MTIRHKYITDCDNVHHHHPHHHHHHQQQQQHLEAKTFKSKIVKFITPSPHRTGRHMMQVCDDKVKARLLSHGNLQIKLNKSY